MSFWHFPTQMPAARVPHVGLTKLVGNFLSIESKGFAGTQRKAWTMARLNNPHKGIRQDATGQWWLDCYIHGKRVRERCKNLVEAQRVQRRMKEEERRERLFPEERRAQDRLITIPQLVALYKEENRNNNVNWKRIELYGSYWVEFLGERLITDVKITDVERYKRMRLDAGRAPSTVNKEVKRLKRLYNLATRDGYLTFNPLARVSQVPGETQRLRYLLEAEEEALKAAMEPKDWFLVEVAFRTGMRQAEQFGLRREHVVLDGATRRIHLNKTKNRTRREVPINADLAVKLREWLSNHPHKWVFPSSTGTRMSPHNFYNRRFVPALEKAGITDFLWHDLRHTFASRLVMQGVDLRTVQELMGHKSITQTQRYAHLSPGHLEAAVELI